MPRTTIDLDARVLRELKRRSRQDGTTIGRLVSELLAGVLREGEVHGPRKLEWRTSRMRARIDLRDKDAVYRALDDR